MTPQLLAITFIALAGAGVVEILVPADRVQIATAHPEASPFEEGADATAQVNAALARASANGKRVILVMGGNWCHDSRGLAGWLGTPRFVELVESNFELVYVDAGKPREDAARNMHIARRFGVDELIGTPNLFVLSSDGRRLNNTEDVLSWRNAASRSEDEIYDYLKQHAPPQTPPQRMR